VYARGGSWPVPFRFPTLKPIPLPTIFLCRLLNRIKSCYPLEVRCRSDQIVFLWHLGGKPIALFVSFRFSGTTRYVLEEVRLALYIPAA